MGGRSRQGGGSILTYLGLSLLSTILFRLSLPPTSLSPVAWVALAPLFWVLARQRPRIAALAAAPAGALIALVSVSGFRHLTWAAYFSPAILGAIYYALVGAAISWAARRRGIPLILAAPMIWTAYEFLRSVVPMAKFPWLLAGQTQVGWIPMIQILDLGGVYLLTFVIATSNAYLAQAALEWRDPARRRKTLFLAALPVGLIAATLVYGVIRIRTIEVVPGPKIALIQGNIPQEIKLSGQAWQMFQDYRRLSEGSLREAPSLIAWPETMYPWVFHPDEWERVDPEARPDLEKVREMLFEVARRGNARLVIGALRTVSENTTNSAYYISETGEFLGRYDKIDLVPLGEMVPFEQAWPALGDFVRQHILPPGYGDLSPGDEIPIFELQGSRFAISICYEISFASLARRAREEGADFLVSISNDAWFKDGAELDMAKDQAIFRAVENRMGIARAANTGISSFVDPVGRSEILVRDGRRKQVEGILVRQVTTSSNTSLYSKIGDLFAWVMVVGSALILLPLNRLGRSRPPAQGPTGGGETAPPGPG